MNIEILWRKQVNILDCQDEVWYFQACPTVIKNSGLACEHFVLPTYRQTFHHLFKKDTFKFIYTH